MKYNQPPIPMSNELKQVLQSSLNLTEAGLINVLSKYDDNYCWGTLNQEAKVFKLSGYSDIEQASAELIDRVGLHDLQLFIDECEG
jgi:hypothetical protein